MVTELQHSTNGHSEQVAPPDTKPELGEGAVIGWWSGGITSAVACRLAIEKYPNVRLVYIETGSHHPDTMRFKADCENWYGQKIETLQNMKYKNHLDVVLSTRYVNGSGGARCTKELKKNVRFDFEKSTKIAAQVWGYEFEESEINRAIRTQEQYAYTNPLFPLIENKLSKNECAGILVNAGIEIPIMYKLGYNNNNCIGCVKGGAGYWNKIRVDFPEIFKQMAEVEREVGASCLKDKNGKIYLDELDPKAGNPTDLVIGECGIFCQVEFAHIMTSEQRIKQLESKIKELLSFIDKFRDLTGFYVNRESDGDTRVLYLYDKTDVKRTLNFLFADLYEKFTDIPDFKLCKLQSSGLYELDFKLNGKDWEIVFPYSHMVEVLNYFSDSKHFCEFCLDYSDNVGNEYSQMGMCEACDTANREAVEQERNMIRLMNGN